MIKGASPLMPTFDYYLDEADLVVLALYRQDGGFVATFSARGATKESIVQAAEEDYRTMILAREGSSLGQAFEEGEEKSA